MNMQIANCNLIYSIFTKIIIYIFQFQLKILSRASERFFPAIDKINQLLNHVFKVAYFLHTDDVGSVGQNFSYNPWLPVFPYLKLLWAIGKEVFDWFSS